MRPESDLVRLLFLERLVEPVLDDSAVVKIFDPAQHPRHPAGAPDSQGGEFAPKLHGLDDAATAQASAASPELGFLAMLGAMRSDLEENGFFNYWSMLTEHGEQSSQVQPGAPKMKARECYNNAITRMIEDQVGYVEGFVFVHGVPIQHAWNRVGGRFVDYTLGADAKRWTYVGLDVPRDVVLKVAISPKFGSGIADGVLGTINLFKQRTVREAMVRSILHENTKGRDGAKKDFDPAQHPRHPAGTPGGRGGEFAPKFDMAEWGAMSMQEARDAWAKLSDFERDALADPTRSVEERIEEILKGRPWDALTDNFNADMVARIDQFRGDMLTNEAADHVSALALATYDSLLVAGAGDRDARVLMAKATDYLIAQEYEACTRTLGDHGIRHLQQDAYLANEILTVGGLATPQARAMMNLAGVFHDAGYLTPPSRVFLDATHPRWSAQNYMRNVGPLVEAALGKAFSQELASIIYAHDDTALDWKRAPLKSAFTTADNFALFHAEKMPALIRYVPLNAHVLVDLGRGKLTVEAAREKMRTNIDRSHLSENLKTALKSSVNEVSGVLPKFTLGMVGTKVERVEWVRDHPKLTIHVHRANEDLGRVVDFNARQFRKIAETYGSSPEAFLRDGRFEVQAEGAVLLEATLTHYAGAGHKQVTGQPWVAKAFDLSDRWEIDTSFNPDEAGWVELPPDAPPDEEAWREVAERPES